MLPGKLFPVNWLRLCVVASSLLFFLPVFYISKCICHLHTNYIRLPGSDDLKLCACLLWFDWSPRRTKGCKRSSYQRWCTAVTGSGFLQRDEERFLVHGLVRRRWIIADRWSHEICEYAIMCKIYILERLNVVFFWANRCLLRCIAAMGPWLQLMSQCRSCWRYLFHCVPFVDNI